MILPGVLFLAADTSRSRAYAQAMATSGLVPADVLRYGPAAAARKPPQPASLPAGLFTPDLGEPLEETTAVWRTEQIPEHDVNDAAVRERIAALGPHLVIFSGTGGQIVSPELLNLGASFLHVHSGWLPADRGSTTLYYSLLRDGSCAASALILDEGIDTGTVIERRRYPPPPPDTDIDHLYDGAIRADLLVRVLARFAETGALPAGTPQTAADGTTFYRIHPVLKHVAILSLERAQHAA